MINYWSEDDVYAAGRRSILARKSAPSKKLLVYLTGFKQDKLSTGTSERLPSFDNQHEQVIGAMCRNFSKQGYRQIVSGGGIDVNIPNFWEVIFVMHFLTKEIEIIGNIDFAKREVEAGIHTQRKIPYAELKIIDERLKQIITAEVLKQNKESVVSLSYNQGKYITNDKVKYQLTYDSTEGILRLNEIKIAKTQYSSENDMFLRFFVAENHNGECEIASLLKFMGKDKLTKRPTQILGDVSITGNIKEVFFPNASIRAIEFRNPITYEYAKEHKLPEIDLKLLSKKSQK